MSSQTNVSQDQNAGPEVTVDEALNLAQGHHQMGNFMLAERTYRDILRAVPDHFPSTMFLGLLLFQNGAQEEAFSYLKTATNTNPDNPHAWNNYGGLMAHVGNYKEAIEAFDKALAIKEDYVDALNNKAYSLWSNDNTKDAEAVARRALELDPENRAAWNNLGIILAKRAQFEEAYEAWEKTVEIAPDDAKAYVNWGNALREAGHLEESRDKCRKAVELEPNNPEALNNLANAVRDLGDAEEAIELYRKATDIMPNYYEAHSNMGIAYLDMRKHQEAAVAARYAIAFKSDFGEGYLTLSFALTELGEYEQAQAAVMRAVSFLPGDAGPYIALAEILLRLQQSENADAALQEALRIEPDNARVYSKLCEVYDLMQNQVLAHQAIDKAIELNPHMFHLIIQKAMLYYIVTDMDNAIKTIDKAIAMAPKRQQAKVHKIDMLVSSGRNEEALELIEKVLESAQEPGNQFVGPYISLVALKQIKSKDDPRYAEMLALEEGVKKSPKNVYTSYYYSLAELHDYLGEYDQAFEYLKIASGARQKVVPFFGDDEKEVHDSLITQYTRDIIDRSRKHGHDSDVPVFILGMPRSGTTLTEQIIASHPDVYGAGELPFIVQTYREVFPDDVVSSAGYKDYGDRYLEALRTRQWDGKTKRVTDKMPANYLYMGFIASVFPNAKIIHCKRNPIDTCLSCYFQNFMRGQRWSYDLENMAGQYIRYHNLMEHWRKIMPDLFLEIQYEETVGDLEAQARKLIDYVGLEWDDACLEPHKQKRAVITASKAQVTQPVYKTSVEKWRRYEEHLQPLIKKLAEAGLVKEDGTSLI